MSVLRQRDPHAMACVAIWIFLVASVWLTARIAWMITLSNLWILTAGVLSGFVAQDFVSGLIHWACDTWGSPATPIIGDPLIRVFREHHSDPKAMTHHGFVATNGANCLATLPALLPALMLPLNGNATWSMYVAAFVLSLTSFGFITNQAHKWAHMDVPPKSAAWLQSRALILPPQHHAIHHATPFDSHYCITTGWMNRPLQRIRFFARLEWLITALTGAQPRVT
ncbi:MAG TPA: fatty acid desaturase CarF family protein [Terriglobia bacterium]